MSKLCVVTGSNKGIGYGIVKELCSKFPGVVYLTSRDEKRGQDAVAELKKLGLNPQYHQLDISDEASISRLHDYIKQKYGGLDCLVNNAAIAYKQAATDPFAVQAEHTVRVNYFDNKLVCNKLFPLLRPGARVVNMSSSAGHLSRISDAALKKKFADPNLTVEQLDALMNDFVTAAQAGNHSEKGWPNSTYVVSKVGVSALSRIQMKQFEAAGKPEGVVVNHCHPGYVDTDMTSHKGPLTIEEGAVSAVFCALLPADTKIKGEYIWKDTQVVDWVDGPLPAQV